MTKKTCGTLLALFLTSSAGAQGLGPAVTVSGTEIPRSKVEAQVNHLINLRGMGSGGITQPSTYRQIQEEVVDQLVVQELLWQEAMRRDFVISEAEVDAELDDIKSNFDGQLAFEFSINEGGFTEKTFRENIRQQRSVRKMVAEDIVAAIQIDDAAISAFYNENLGQMQMPEQVRARHILIEVAQDADNAARAAAREKIEEVKKLLEQGASFALTAIEHSEGPTAPQGGDLGFFQRGQMVPAFEEVAFALEPGSVSNVVETDFGLHLIKVEERVEERFVSLEEAAPQIRDYLGQRALEEKLSGLIDTLRTQNDVKIHLW